MKKKIEQFANNCTLVAVREVTGRSDEEIIRAFEEKGWKRGHGFATVRYVAIVKNVFGHSVKEVDTTIPGRKMLDSWVTYTDSWGDRRERFTRSYKMTLAMFSKNYPTGTYLITVPGHALVVRDGRVIDPNYSKVGMSRRVISAFLIEDAAPSYYARSQVVPLGRGEDPLVRFVGVSQRSVSQDPYYRENEALLQFLRENDASWLRDNLKPVRLSTLIEKTRYLRRDAAWDILRGRLVRVPE